MKDTTAQPDAAEFASPSAAAPPAEFSGGMRVSDKVLGAFNHACALGDLEAAEELLGVLERITDRRIRRFGGNRRRDSFILCHAREHLAWQKAQRAG